MPSCVYCWPRNVANVNQELSILKRVGCFYLKEEGEKHPSTTSCLSILSSHSGAILMRIIFLDGMAVPSGMALLVGLT